MGSATDGLTPWDYAAALGYPSGSYAVPGAGYAGTGYSGSVTDGPRIAFAPPAAAAPLPFQAYTPPAPAAAPPPAVAAPPPAPPPEPPPPAPPPPPPVVPIDPGGPIDQPTSLGNALGGAITNPPKYWVGSPSSYKKSPAGTTGAITTTQT